MLSKQYRLPLSARTFLKNSIASPLFTLRYNPNGLPTSRFAFIVSKKIDKRAVGRNSIKRLFRVSIQELLEIITPGNDILLIVKSGSKEKNKEEIKNAIRETLEKGKLLHE